MRRTVVLIACVVCSAALAACGGSTTKAGTESTASTTGSTPSTAAATTSTTGARTSTSTSCAPPPPMPTAPVSSPAKGAQHLLTDVAVTHDACVDTVTMTFTAQTADPPTYTVSYQSGPFTQDASGAPVSVAGNAFVVVRLEPAAGFDFVAGKPTYTGPKDVEGAGAHHVTQVVETGDFEGVVTWVIGLDTKRPFAVQATGAPSHTLAVTIS